MTTIEKKESYRKYLETSGVIDALTKGKNMDAIYENASALVLAGTTPEDEKKKRGIHIMKK